MVVQTLLGIALLCSQVHLAPKPLKPVYSAKNVKSEKLRLGRALLKAAWNDDCDEVESLIKKGADVNFSGPVRDQVFAGRPVMLVRVKTTALNLASEMGDLDLIRLLLEHKANISVRDQDGNTPLHTATDQGDVELVKFLLNHGADYRLKNIYGYTALMLSERDEQPADDEESEAIKQLILKRIEQDRKHKATLKQRSPLPTQHDPKKR